jgi:four helix bundle protein
MRDFRKLQVWQKAHRLVLSIYKATTRFPKAEAYGMVRQMRRAAMSIPTNIAEGCGRDGEAELRRFIQIAMGSASELEYEILLARDLGFLNQNEHDQLIEDACEIKRMLTAYHQKLTADN